jgi:hypothetical protein
VTGLARALAALALSLATAQAAPDRGQKACEAIEYRIDALAGFTSTICTPAGGKRPGTLSFFVLSQATVFGDEDRKRLWLVVAVAAVGSVLNEDRSLAVEDLSLSDSQTVARERLVFTMPASVAKRLQERLRSGQIDEAAMYREIVGALREERAAKGEPPRREAPRKEAAPGSPRR